MLTCKSTLACSFSGFRVFSRASDRSTILADRWTTSLFLTLLVHHNYSLSVAKAANTKQPSRRKVTEPAIEISRMDFPILIKWVSPLSFLGTLGVVFHCCFIFDEFQASKQNSPRWDAAFCGVTSGTILFAVVP